MRQEQEGNMKKTYIVTVVVKSETGEKPIVRSLGEIVFVYLTKGMTASFTTTRKKATGPTVPLCYPTQ